MLGLKTLPNHRLLVISVPTSCMIHRIRPHHLTIRKQFQSPRNLVIYAKEQRNIDEKEQSTEAVPGNGNENDSDPENKQAPFFKVRWTELLLDPNPDNVLSVGLTGLLTWASAQVVWQLLAVSFSIVVAALKYSFVAALLIFILVALL